MFPLYMCSPCPVPTRLFPHETRVTCFPPPGPGAFPTLTIIRKAGKRYSGSAKAGLQFPVGRLRRYLKKMEIAPRIGSGAPVYLAAVLEYLTAEIVELAGNAAKDNKLSRISPRHIMLAVRNDEELDRLLWKAIIPESGVMPNIHAVLIPKPKKFEE